LCRPIFFLYPLICKGFSDIKGKIKKLPSSVLFKNA
jgi:hypothetical protein